MKKSGRNQCLLIWMSKVPEVATFSVNQYFGQLLMPAILYSYVIFTSRWLEQDQPSKPGHYSVGGSASLTARHCPINTENPLKTCHLLWMQIIFKLVPQNWNTVLFLKYFPLKPTLLADSMVNSVPFFICVLTWKRSSRRHAKAQAVILECNQLYWFLNWP